MKLKENAECGIAKEVEAMIAPHLISSCETIEDITSINLAAEGMILCKLKKVSILTAVISGWTKLERFLVFRVCFITT